MNLNLQKPKAADGSVQVEAAKQKQSVPEGSVEVETDKKAEKVLF